MPTLPSKKEIDASKPKFPLLPNEDYLLKVESLEQVTQWDYNHIEEIEVVKATFSIVSLKDGTIAVDEHGQKLHPKRTMIRDLDENRMGYTQEGLPSLTRQFVSYMLGVSPFSEDESFNFNWQDFVGKIIGAKIVQYMIKKGKNAGQVGNKIDCFLPLKKKTLEEQLNAPEEEIPVQEDENNIDVKSIPF